MPKGVTIREVAKRAGVSISTVSRVLNEKPHNYIREETRCKVLKAIEELNYKPDRRAQSLRGVKTGIIGLVMPIGLNPFYEQLAYAIENVCYREGYGMLICDSHGNIDRERTYIDILVRQKVDGIIITTIELKKEDLEELINRGITVILADEDVPEVNAPAVFANNYLGACQATKHLINLGHKRIAFITGPLNVLSGRDRLKGYLDTLKENNLEIDETIIKEGDYTYKKGYIATQKLLKESDSRFTAIFCSNDLTAFGAMRALQDKGWKVPEDYSVVGFDDMYFSSISNPQLTTVAQPVDKMALRIFQAFKQEISGRAPLKKRHQFLDTNLIVRESSRKLD